jgi:single-stranded-DNA-specific exonuclease
MHWIEPEQIAIPASYSGGIGGHPLVASTLYQRGLHSLDDALAYINPDHYRPNPTSELPGLTLAIEMLMGAIDQKTPTCVWGDFDVDGQTATTTLVSGLRHFGVQVQHYIPVRGQESHGLNIDSLAAILNAGTKLLITCDTGISDIESVAYARAQGVEVIITDHHDLPDKLPNANAILNPKQLNPNHPFYTLPGVGVAFLLIKALGESLDDPEYAEILLDLAALGIVADVAELRGEARYLLQQGLPALRNTERIGLQALMKVAELDPANLTEEHIGFSLGPRLNALGRLGDTNPIVDFLTTEDPVQARLFANHLEGLNARRQLLTDQVFRSALEIVDRKPSYLGYDVLILSHPTWPGGVVGIVASRLAERFGRPVILLTAPEGEPARGSARSVLGVDITRAISQHYDLLHSFGGHPMAAGLSLDQKDIESFRQAISNTVAEQKAEVTPEPLRIDANVELKEVDFEFVAAIERLAPFGQGNPPPVLAAKDVLINDQRVIGRSDDHLILNLADSEQNIFRILWWNGAGMAIPEGRFDLAYTARRSTYRGREQIQIEWIDWRQLHDQPAVIETGLQMEVIDHRNETDPEMYLTAILEIEEDVLLWREGLVAERVTGVDRFGVQQAAALVIWTLPGSLEILNDVIKNVQPKRLYLFANDPGYSSSPEFVAGLAGLAKFTINHKNGRLNTEKLAVKLGYPTGTVEAGLEWLACRGDITIDNSEGVLWEIRAGGQASSQAEARTRILEECLQETTAFRQHYQRVEHGFLVLK